MIEIVGAISLISLVINILLYKRITTTYVLGSVEQFEPAILNESRILNCCCFKDEPNEPETVTEEVVHAPVTVPMVQEVYSAWKNQKDIPWVPPTKLPEPINKPPSRGPLARPDGFI